MSARFFLMNFPVLVHVQDKYLNWYLRSWIANFHLLATCLSLLCRTQRAVVQAMVLMRYKQTTLILFFFHRKNPCCVAFHTAFLSLYFFPSASLFLSLSLKFPFCYLFLFLFRSITLHLLGEHLQPHYGWSLTAPFRQIRTPLGAWYCISLIPSPFLPLLRSPSSPPPLLPLFPASFLVALSLACLCSFLRANVFY